MIVKSSRRFVSSSNGIVYLNVVTSVTPVVQDAPGHPAGGRHGDLQAGGGSAGQADRPQHVPEEEAGGGHVPAAPRQAEAQDPGDGPEISQSDQRG